MLGKSFLHGLDGNNPKRRIQISDSKIVLIYIQSLFQTTITESSKYFPVLL
jgi:hypothetical protein